MICLRYIMVLILGATSPSIAVRVNLHGSLRLGREVVDTISQYINSQIGGRRSMPLFDPKQSERITFAVKSAALCRGLEMCEDKSAFVNEYIVILANAVESIFEGILNSNTERRQQKSHIKAAIFEEQLKKILFDSKKLLKQADSQISKDKKVFIWTDVLKKISAKFQETALQFVHERLEGEPKETLDVNKKLVQKLILAIIIVEIKYENNLCSQYNICEKVLECTKSLNTLIEQFKEMPDDKARMFMKYFHESLPDKFSYLNDETANEFKKILNDMTYSKTVPTRNILLSVQKAVEDRLKNKTNLDLSKRAYDVLLVHVILSDLDHFYTSRERVYNFDGFLTNFATWVISGGRFHSEIKQVMEDIKKRLADQPKELRDKLTNEIKVFLELTVLD